MVNMRRFYRGWVERSETQHLWLTIMLGFATLNPTYIFTYTGRGADACSNSFILFARTFSRMLIFKLMSTLNNHLLACCL